MKKVLKIAQSILSYVLLFVAIVGFVAPVLVWALSQYVEDPKLAKETIRLVIKELSGKDVK